MPIAVFTLTGEASRSVGGTKSAATGVRLGFHNTFNVPKSLALAFVTEIKFNLIGPELLCTEI